MKKSAILFELIISILILSIVGIYTLLFLSNLYKTNAQNIKMLNTKLDFQTTYLFIENTLKQSVNISPNSDEILFYEVDINSFKSGYYSGFALLEKSSKEFVFTPNSSISKIDSNFIWFVDNSIHEIEKSFENDKIYFKNKTSEKKIYEQYKLLKNESKIFLNDNKLFFNQSILLNDIKSFNVKLSNKILIIDICDKRCFNWVITL